VTTPGIMDHARVRTATVGLVLVLAAVYSGLVVWSVQSDQANDFAVYYLAGRMYADGADPYGVTQPAWDQLANREGIGHWEYPYRYPPPTAGVARLLLPFGPHDAAIAWGMLSAAALIGGALLLGHTLGGGKRTPVALLALLLWYPACHTLQVGQVNAFVFAALVLALWALTRERFAAAGAALAVGVALKITPLALVAYLAWQRRWRSLPAAVASLAALCVVLLPLTGVNTYAAYLGRALRLTRQSDVLVSPGIDGVRSFFGRLLLPGTATTATPGGALVARLALGVVIGLVCVSAAALWRPRRRTHDAAADLDAAAAHAADAAALPFDFSLVVSLSLVVAPFTFYHQYVLLLIPLTVVGCHLWSRLRRGSLALVLVLALGVDANQVLWVVARPFIVEHGLWRLFSLPFLLAMTLWALSGLEAGKIRRRLALQHSPSTGARPARLARRGGIEGDRG
jgi:hypothetical protein